MKGLLSPFKKTKKVLGAEVWPKLGVPAWRLEGTEKPQWRAFSEKTSQAQAGLVFLC